MKTKTNFSLRAALAVITVALCSLGCQPQHDLYRDIHAAARAGDVSEVTADLAQNPSDLELPDNAGFTPLYLAAAACQTNVVALLLDKGAKIDIRAKDGSTPLQEAAQQGCQGCVLLLLDRGATVNIRNNQGKTPLGSAELWHQDAIVELLRQHGGKE
jgi:ankyrin repeat protein